MAYSVKKMIFMQAQVKISIILVTVFAQNMVSAESFDETVNAFGGAQAFDIILVQDCSVLDNSADVALDQKYNAKLCSAEADSALADLELIAL